MLYCNKTSGTVIDYDCEMGNLDTASDLNGYPGG